MYEDSVPYPKLETWLVLVLEFLSLVCFAHLLLTVFNRSYVLGNGWKPKALLGKANKFHWCSYARVDSVEGQWVYHLFFYGSIQLSCTSYSLQPSQCLNFILFVLIGRDIPCLWCSEKSKLLDLKNQNINFLTTGKGNGKTNCVLICFEYLW